LHIIKTVHNFLHPPLIRMSRWLKHAVDSKVTDNCDHEQQAAGGGKSESQNKPAQMSSGTKERAAQQTTSNEKTGQFLAEASMDKEPEEKLPDVLLDVPSLKIDEIKLNVDNLDARVALRAELANLVKIDIGVQIGIAKVDLDIKGVDAQAVLKVRLKQIYAILSRALETVDKNPELLENLLKSMGDATGKEAGKSIFKTSGTLESKVKKAAEAGEQSLGPLAVEGAKGVKAQKGQLSEALGSVSKNVDQSIEPRSEVSEEKRRKMNRIDKK
jgi:hypothetical protein